jgi:hypothetical protein
MKTSWNFHLSTILGVGTVLMVLSNLPAFSYAQGLIKDPFDGAVQWSVRLAEPQTNGGTLRVEFEGRIREGFHVFSAIPPDQDANLPTIIELEPGLKGIKVEGKLDERGKLITEFDDVFGTKVRYYKNDVLFLQTFTVKGKGSRLKGALVYQVCDEEGLCASQKQPFDFKAP